MLEMECIAKMGWLELEIWVGGCNYQASQLIS